jgi:inosine/guanosine/xanthosine phosphorylase family protein
MRITDHINAMGDNPLVGPHDPAWGPRFPDQSAVYDAALSRALDDAASHTGTPLKRGVYLAARGPVYETPAEIRAFRALGADAIGMSTVPEAILASAAGMRVAAVSCITNPAAGLADGPLSHEEVLQASAAAQQRIIPLLLRFLETPPP